MTRTAKGIFGWSALALILGIIVIIPMMLREFYQYRFQNTEQRPFEWDDVFLYGLLICIFSMFHWCIADIAFSAPWWCDL